MQDLQKVVDESKKVEDYSNKKNECKQKDSPVTFKLLNQQKVTNSADYRTKVTVNTSTNFVSKSLNLDSYERFGWKVETVSTVVGLFFKFILKHERT